MSGPRRCDDRTADISVTSVRPLSHGERAGVRGYGLSMNPNPSPGASRRPLPMGEVIPSTPHRQRAIHDRTLPRAVDDHGAELVAFFHREMRLFHREMRLRRLRQRELGGDVVDALTGGEPF